MYRFIPIRYEFVPTFAATTANTALCPHAKGQRLRIFHGVRAAIAALGNFRIGAVFILAYLSTAVNQKLRAEWGEHKARRKYLVFSTFPSYIDKFQELVYNKIT